MLVMSLAVALAVAPQVSDAQPGKDRRAVGADFREQASKLEFTVDLERARALGLQIPQPVLLRADQVIE